MKLGEKGQSAESLEKFKKAYALYPSPNTLCNVARQEQLLGRKLQALRDYREAFSRSSQARRSCGWFGRRAPRRREVRRGSLRRSGWGTRAPRSAATFDA